MILCRHCKKGEGNRGRGLCSKCYYRLEIRIQYGPVSKYGNRIGKDKSPRKRKPSEPTTAFVGSEEKIRVIEKRLAANEPLWHPQDELHYA